MLEDAAKSVGMGNTLNSVFFFVFVVATSSGELLLELKGARWASTSYKWSDMGPLLMAKNILVL